MDRNKDKNFFLWEKVKKKLNNDWRSHLSFAVYM
jgi:hypothetical protein